MADPDGVTALTYATVNGHYDVAMYLLEHGADASIVDNYGRGVLYAAIDMNRPELEPRPPVNTEDRTTALDVAAALWSPVLFTLSVVGGFLAFVSLRLERRK